jgi:hypothetical protein
LPDKSGKRKCLRCGKRVADDSPARIAQGVAAMGDCGVELNAAAPASRQAPLDFDDWDLDPDLRSFRTSKASQKLAAMPATYPGDHPSWGYAPQSAAAPWPPQMVAHYAAPHGAIAGPHYKPQPAEPRAKRASLAAWMVMSLGLSAFACGGMLLGWSFATGRADLWNMGLPITVGGQIALLVGLVIQLERMWQNHRYAVEKLEEVDERLADMKQAQSLLGVNHGSAAQAFYAHMAEGASPSLLLADLKGQLDLLATRLAERGG